MSLQNVWEELPADVQLALTPQAALNRKPAKLHPYRRNLRSLTYQEKIYAALKADQAMRRNEIMEKLEAKTGTPA